MMNSPALRQSLAGHEPRPRIAEYGPLVLDGNGKPAIRLPADWGGLTVQRFQLPTNAESGPMFTGDPIVFISTGGAGKRWYKSGIYVRALATGPFIDTYSATFERDRAEWKGEGGESIGIRVPSIAITRLMHDMPFDLDMRFNVVDEQLAHVAQLFANEMQNGMPNGRLFAEGLSLTLLGWLAKHYGVAPQAVSAPTRCLSESHQRLVRDFIDVHIGEDMSVVRLAMLVNASPNHFARMFKSTFTIPPHRFVMLRRVELAAEALKTSDALSIAQLALAFGFASQAHFTEAFRRVTGVTPALWRSSHRPRLSHSAH